MDEALRAVFDPGMLHLVLVGDAALIRQQLGGTLPVEIEGR